jgi:tetrapyrrole methylase family protein/MazG family protein
MTRHTPFTEFVDTIARLRAPDGCAWDRAQTHESLTRHMIEEAYEAVEAIESGNVADIREELGDVLLQVVLQCQIAQDAGEFTIDDVCRDINVKMIRRHPHVFDVEGGSSHMKGDSPEDVKNIWEKIKRGEKEQSREEQSKNGQQKSEQSDIVAPPDFLDDVSTAQPALMQAQKISKKVIDVGFEWETIDDIWNQVFSEIDELRAEYACADKDSRGRVSHNRAVELEVGDVLFTFVNVALRLGIDAETSLRASSHKFRKRWSFIENAARSQDRRIEDLSFEEMSALWDKAKERDSD